VDDTAAESRPYAGVSSEERHARRRAALVEAGLELFGTRGYAASSVREICLAASLNRRYFYESFRTREDLLRAVYDEITDELSAALLEAVGAVDDIGSKIRVGMTVFWEVMATDLRKARVLTIEMIGVSEELERHRREVRHGFADFVAGQVLALAAAQNQALRLDATLAARGLVAATMDLVVDWMRGDVGYSLPELTEHCIRLYTIAGGAAFYDVEEPTASD